MSHEPDPTASLGGRSLGEVSQIASILEAYLNELERGGHPDQEALLAKHPELADALRLYFTNLDMLHRAAVGLQNSASGDLPLIGAETRPAARLGEYQIIREIGRGGMGVVYEAQQLSLGRRVALKVLPFAAVLDPIRLQRFKNEAMAAASLEHPNIVHIHSVGCERGVHFYAMQLVDGHTLAEVIRQRRCERGLESDSESVHTQPLTGGHAALASFQSTANNHLSTEPLSRDSDPFQTIANLGLQAAEALQYAHARGIRHRDIKPSNLLVDATGKLWVTDFGLAHVDHDASLTMTGHLIGTLRHMSPEQVTAKPELVDHRADIYGLGATLYEMLTLQPLFPSENHQELQRQIVSEEPQRPRLLNPAIPVDLETIVLKAVAKDLPERYANAWAMADDLRRFRQHQPILARPPTWIDRAAKWSRRHTALIAELSLFLVLITVGLAVATLLVWRERQKAVQQRNEAQYQTRLAVERETMLRRHAYASEMSLAWRWWEFGNVQQIRDLLRRQQPAPGQEDLRGFEWFLLNRLLQSGTLLRTFAGHESDVHCVRFSPDGNTLATTGGDNTVRLWDVASGQQKAVLLGHTSDVDAVVFYPDGRTIATSSDDGTIRRWDIDSQKEIASIKAHEHWITHLQLASKKQLLVSGGRDNFIKTWDATSLREVASRAADPTVHCIALAPDGKTIVSGNQEVITTWDVENLERRTQWQAHGNRVLGISYSPDGSKLASVGEDGWLRIWNEQGQLQFKAEGIFEHHRAVQFSNDGRWLAAGTRHGLVRLWNAFSRTQLGILDGHTGQVWSLAFSPSGELLASAGEDRTVKLWRICNPVSSYTVLNRNSRLDRVSMNAAAGLVAWTSSFGSDDQSELVTLINVVSGTAADEVHLPRGMQCAAVSPDERVIAVACDDGNVRIWNRGTSSFQAEFAPDGAPLSLHFSPDGRVLAGCCAGDYGFGHTWFWDLSNPVRQLPVPPKLKKTLAIAFAPNGRWVATQERETGYVVIWDLTSFEPLHTFPALTPESTIRFLKFSDDSRFLAVCDENILLKVFDLGSGKALPYFERSDVRMSCLAFSRNGKTLATGHADGTVHFWDLATGHDLGSVKAHEHRVFAIGFLPNHRGMITAGLGCSALRSQPVEHGGTEPLSGMALATGFSITPRAASIGWFLATHH